MPKITRKQQKVFAVNASNNGVFGSLQANDPTYSQDPDLIQGRTAYSNGWNDATFSSEKLPPLEEFQGLQYLFSRQIAYLYQDGIPEWNASTTYYQGSIVKSLGVDSMGLYYSLIDDNTGNLITDTTKWQKFYDSSAAYADINLSNLSSSGTRLVVRTGMISQFGSSTAPSGWLICDGSAVSRTTYSALFAVIGTTYGTGDGSTTFNLPNISSIVTSVNTTVPIKGTGKTLGITNGSTNYGLVTTKPGTSGSNFSADTNAYNKSLPYDRPSGTSTLSAAQIGLGVTTNASNSGIQGTVTRSVFSIKFIIKY